MKKPKKLLTHITRKLPTLRRLYGAQRKSRKSRKVKRIMKRQAVKKLIQCVAIIAAGVLAIILFMLAIWYRGKNSEPVTDEQVAAQMQQAEPLVIETPEATAEGSIRVEFKYIHVMEIGKKGARHHHLVVNKIDTEILQRCWYKAYEGHNRVKVFPLDDSGNYAELASYLIKYTGTHKKGTDGALQGKRWNCSKNLVRPEPEYHIISDREYFKKEPKAIKGYYVDKNSVSMGVHSPEYYGYGYLRYTLVKITDRGG